MVYCQLEPQNYLHQQAFLSYVFSDCAPETYSLSRCSTGSCKKYTERITKSTNILSVQGGGEMTQTEKGSPSRSLFWPPSPGPLSKRRRGEGDVSTAGIRVSVYVLSRGGARPGQGRPSRARAYSGFSGHSIRQRLSRKRLSRSRAAAPGRLSPRKKSCRPLRGRDSGPGPGNGGGGGGGLTEAPRASAWRVSPRLIPTGERPA